MRDHVTQYLRVYHVWQSGDKIVMSGPRSGHRTLTMSHTAASPEPPDSEDNKEQEYQFNSSENTPRHQHSPSYSPTVPLIAKEDDSALGSADLISNAESTSTLSLFSEKSTSMVSSLIVEPISNIVVTPTTTPKLGNLWHALRSTQIRTLLYSSMVAVMASLSFGYGIGYSSPTLSDLEANKGEYTSFRKAIYRDTFNVSDIIV